MEEIATNRDHVWNSKETNSGPQAWYRQESEPAGNPASSAKPFDAKKLAALPKENQPTFLKPQLAQETEQAARYSRLAA